MPTSEKTYNKHSHTAFAITDLNGKANRKGVSVNHKQNLNYTQSCPTMVQSHPCKGVRMVLGHEAQH